MVWYLMISYDSIAWYCMLLRCWLRRAGCVSQDAYILHETKTQFLLYESKAQSHCVNYNGGLNINLRLNMKPEYNLDITLFSAWGRLDGVRWQYKEMAESLIKKGSTTDFLGSPNSQSLLSWLAILRTPY